MTMKNRHAITERQFRQVVKLFILDLDATQLAALPGLNHNTINRYFRGIRRGITKYCELQSPFAGEIRVNESYFCSRHIEGKRGREALGLTAVFGVSRANGCLYTGIIPDCSRSTVQSIIRGRFDLDSVIYSDSWCGCNGLGDVGYGKHLRVNHVEDEFVRGRPLINEIEGFWGNSRFRTNRFRGMNKHTFYLH